MTHRKSRGLRPDEEELWEKVRRSTVPLRLTPAQTVKEAIKPRKQVAEQFAVPLFEIGEAQTSTVLPSYRDSKPSANPPVQMDRKNYGRMKKGKLSPEGRIDLHGMTVAQAHPVLVRFIIESHNAGKRLVLVITGKGKDRSDLGPIPARRGILKHQVPQWLNVSPLKPIVLQIAEANPKHGGGGAYYVYLRRMRK